MENKIRVLLTGGSGLVGRNILDILREKYDVTAPSRNELDILNTRDVEEYVISGKFDIIVHSANPNGVKNPIDKDVDMVDGSLRCFMNLYRLQPYYKRMFYVGSGAELAKTRDIADATEEEFDNYVPEDSYGFAKYIMTNIARGNKKIINLRLFACYGPGDYYTKFITHCIDCINEGREITIRQDCVFDYIHVYDFGRIISWFISQECLKYQEYNICSGEKHKLSEIADMVKKEMGSELPVNILKNGMNYEYTASNKRLLNEMGNYDFISLEQGIHMQVMYDKENKYEKCKKEDGGFNYK